MPTRLIHDGFLTSPSVRICTPAAQDALPRFWLLADDFGCFDAAPRVLVGKGWPYREDVTEERVRAWLVEYAMAGMLTLWEENGRWWGFLTGWWEHQRFRAEYSEKNRKGSKRKTPRPPTEQGDVAGFAAGRAPVSRVPGNFPGGKHRIETANDSADVSVPVRGARVDPAVFPGGKPSLAVDFPDTQSQSQSQSQPQPERRPGLGHLGEIWHQAKGTPFAGPVRTKVDVMLDEGFSVQHLEGALREALRAERAGECRTLPGTFETLVHKTPLGGEFHWESERTSKKPEIKSRYKLAAPPPLHPEPPKESGS